MKLEIVKIRLAELDNFIRSETYKNLKQVPITPARAASYLANPNARPGDVALYLGFLDGKLVAYRSLFAGVAQTENEKIRFAWCSGNWVHPDYRRKGFSKKLLEEAYSDWDGKLMFTNYAPESEKLYLKTGWFKPIYEFKGVRAYLFPKTTKLLSAAKKNKFNRLFFPFIDFGIEKISEVRTWFYLPKKNPEIDFEVLFEPDKECYELIRNSKEKYLFPRNETELKWIFKFPWISIANKGMEEKYQFSAVSDSFYYRTVKIFQSGRVAGFFIFSVKEKQLKTLYFCLQPGLEKEVANYIRLFSKINHIELATIYNSEVAQQLFNRKFPFLHVKKYGQKIYSSFKIERAGDFHFESMMLEIQSSL